MEEGQQHARVFEERAFENFGFRFRLVEGRHAERGGQEHEPREERGPHDRGEPERAVFGLIVHDLGQGELGPAAAAHFHGDRQHDHKQRNLIGKHHDHLAGEADAAVGRAGRGARQHDRHRRDGEQVEDDQQVAHLGQAVGHAGHGQQRRAHGDAAERDHGGREERPAHGGGRDDDLLGAQLDEIEEGLDQRRPHPALEPGFDAAVAPFEEQAQRQREQAAGEDDKVENAHKQV